MRITKTNNAKKVMFEQVDQGSIISYNEKLYMRIPCVTQVDVANFDTHNANVVNLETGALLHLPPNLLIILLEDYEFNYSV